MRSPVSASPDSSHWPGVPSHSTPQSASPHPFQHHSTPQRLGPPTPKSVQGRLTPARHYESRLLSSLRSPYQNSYTPLSATPCGASPAFKTPIRITNSSASPHPVRTPLGTKLPKSASKFITPQSQIVNPFEEAMLSRYHGSVLSPWAFALTETPSSEGKGSPSFRWSIDQMAILHPADIDEMSCKHSQRTRYDKDVEEKAQQAIRDFFAKNNIVPSPMPGSSGKPVFIAVPKSPKPDTNSSPCEESCRPKQTQDVGCQTTLTLPIEFDLQKHLGEFMTYQGSDEENNPQEALSTSTLRRKLFFCGESSPPLSPDRKVGHEIAMQCGGSPNVVPLKPFSLSHDAHSASPQFSSSPITLSMGGALSRVSEEMDGITSPELSPIKLQQSPGIRRSEGGSLYGSFMSSPTLPRSLKRSAIRNQHNAMASPELSPICPGSKVRSRLSLDMSPIVSPGVRGQRVLSPQVGGLCKESDPEDKASPHPRSMCTALSTPSTISTSKASDNSVLVTAATLVTTPQVIQPNENWEVPVQSSSTKTENHPLTGEAFQHPRLLMSDISMDITGMETDYVAHSTEIPLQTNLPDTGMDDKSLSYPASRDCSMLFDEMTHQGSVGNVPTSQYSQDTGYQTCSLQLTNQDTGLTQQFGYLPFKSYSEMDCVEGTTAPEKQLPRPVILKEKLDAVNTSVVSRQLSFPAAGSAAFTQEKVDCMQTASYLKTELEGCALIAEGLTEDQVIAKARYLLGKTVSVSSVSSSKPVCGGDQTGSEVSSQPDSMPHLTWQPSCSSTPQKTGVLLSEPEFQPSSELAIAIMRRAEDDLVRYANLAVTSQTP